MSKFWEIIFAVYIALNLIEIFILNFYLALEHYEPFGSKDFYKNTIWWFRLPIDGVKSLYRYYNIFGTIILASIGILFYPAVAVTMMAWCILSTFVWVFQLVFKRKEKNHD